MKKVLIITDTFPPYKHIGRFRIQQFSKYLPDFGWEPIILTPTSSCLWEKDNTLLKEIPANLKVFRPFLPPTLPIITRNISNRFRENKKSGEADIPQSNEKYIEKKSKLKKITIFIINTFNKFLTKHILIPGTEILWVPFAISKAIRIIKEYKVDIIFSSVPVYSNHIVAYFLKMLTQKPWVADYRDLWTNDITRRKRFTEFRGSVERMMEKKLLKHMDFIIFVSAQKIPVIKSEFPDFLFKKTAIIPNGFDPDMITESLTRYIKKNMLKIVYTGRITAHRHHNKFLLSIGKLLERRPKLKDVLKIYFIGKISKIEKRVFDEIAKKYSLEKNIVFMGWVDHKSCMKIQREADLLLLIVDSVKFAEAILPGKVFEYIIANRPILTLAPNGDTKNIILQTSTGIVVPPNDVENISQAVFEFYQKWKENKLYINPNWDIINQYDRKKLTAKLANIFYGLLNEY